MKGQRGCWHYRLNDYFFGKGYSESNKNTCPYFWGTLLAIGFAWIKWIAVSIVDHCPDVELPSLSYEKKQRIGRIVGWLLIGFVLTGVIIYGAVISWYHVALVVLLVVGVTGMVLGISFLGVIIKEKWDEWRFRHPKKNKSPKPPRKNMVKEQVGAWYHSHCPRLEWED